MRFIRFTMIGVVLAVLAVSPVPPSIKSTSGYLSPQIQLDQDTANISELVLTLESDEVELGDRLLVQYGILSNTSEYIANISQQMMLLQGEFETEEVSLQNMNYSLILNETSKPGLQSLEIDTLPPNNKHLIPGPYTVFYKTQRENSTNYNTSKVFRVFPQEGANINIAFSEINETEKISSPVPLDVNETREFEITATNSGSGNALEVFLDIESINGPLQVDTSQFPLSIPVLGSLNQTTIDFSVVAPDFGISEVQFTLTYNRTSGRTLKESPAIEFHCLPDIRGAFEFSRNRVVKTGDQVEFNIRITNFEEDTFLTRFFLSSPSFSFSPSQTQQIELEPGSRQFVFNGITFTNGTETIILFMTYIDPNGNDEISVELNNIEIEVETSPSNRQQQFSLPTALVIFLYLLLILIFVGIIFSRRIRLFVLKHVFQNEFIPDMSFNRDTVIVDGSNVAWEELNGNGRPKVENILLAIERLKDYGFEEILVVADAALRYQIENPKNLDTESKAGTIKVLPAKVDGDSFILRLSRDLGALILTNDLYKEYRDEFKWIDDRRIPYTILDGNLYLHPIYDLD